MIDFLYQKRIIFVVLVYSLAVYFSSGYYHFDEHFQLIEFAGLKLGINTPSDMPWEYKSQLRPALQPLIVYLICKVFMLVGFYNPFAIAFFLRLISAILALFASLAFYRVFENEIKNEKHRKIFFLLNIFLWFAVFNKVRFTSENWSASIFMIAIYVYFLKDRKQIINILFSGLLLGISFIIKFQLGFFIAGFCAWLFFIKKENIKSLMLLIFGILIAISIGVIIDYWFYQQWVFTAWNYLQQLLFAKYVGSFENEPWWYFFDETFNKTIPPFSIAFMLSFVFVFFFKPKHILTWILFPFLLIHFFIGHKEIRFLFPVIPFMPFLLVYSHEVLIEKFANYRTIVQRKVPKFFISLFWIFNTIFLLIITFKSADSQISLYKTIYDKYDGNVVIYYIENNPYHRVLDIHYYKKENVRFQHIDSIQQVKLKINSTAIFVTEQPSLCLGNNIMVIEVYNTFPLWIKKFNYNNWLARSKSWHAFELKEKSNNL